MSSYIDIQIAEEERKKRRDAEILDRAFNRWANHPLTRKTTRHCPLCGYSASVGSGIYYCPKHGLELK